MKYETAAQCWARLDGLRTSFMTRIERYAQLTIQKVCLPVGTDIMSHEQSHDYQSLGAQAVNNVVNKLMIAMFAPSRPFFRVAAGKSAMKKAAEQKLTETQLEAMMAEVERKASRNLDSKGQRPKLYQACRHLVITGNVLLIFDKTKLRVMGLRYFCVKRTHEGAIHTLVIREQMRFDELDPVAQRACPSHYAEDSMVGYYKLIKRTPKGGYKMTQWVDEYWLGQDFDASWSSEDKLPYKVLTWDLSDEADYATGLVEDYAGDFESLSVLSEAVTVGGVVATEFRWVMDPQGVTNVDDFKNAENGDTIPGKLKDIGAVSPQLGEALKTAQAINADYVQRISRGFLMGSALTRDAERVTAEEIRMQAMELESSFGGVYSGLAPSFQRPAAQWLLKLDGNGIDGTDFELIIITGLDALSRNGDLSALKEGLGTLASFAQAPDGLLQRIKWTELGTFVGQAVGINLNRFLMTDEEFAQVQQAMQAQAAAQAGAEAQATASGEAAGTPPSQQ